jgi:hypothetical protein
MARPNPAITQRKSDPHSTQIIVLGRVVAPRASLVVTSTFFGIAGPPLAWSAHKETPTASRTQVPARLLLGNGWLSLAFLGWGGCGCAASLTSGATSGLIRHGNWIAFVFGTGSAYGCAGSLFVTALRWDDWLIVVCGNRDVTVPARSLILGRWMFHQKTEPVESVRANASPSTVEVDRVI